MSKHNNKRRNNNNDINNGSNCNSRNGRNNGKTSNNNRSNGNNNLLPLHVIMAAVSGDAGAIRAVLKHYRGYILTLSLKPFYDQYGRRYLFVDEELRRELETRLITKILTFKPKVA